jgi:HD-GYP domain-containing protein (c-di-GMP phosphodiesterase class II)
MVRNYAQDDLRDMMILASNLAPAIRNSQLYDQAQREIAERNRAEEKLQRQLNRLAALRHIDIAITSSINLDVTFNVLLNQISEQLNASAVAIVYFDKAINMLEYRALQGFHTNKLIKERLTLGEGLAGKIALERKSIFISDLKKHPITPRFLEFINSENFETYCGTPAIAKGEVKGIIEVYFRSPFVPDQEWLDYFETLAGQTAIAIDNAVMFDTLQRANTELSIAYDATLEGWAKALELRDGETEGHSRRLTEMTTKLSKIFGFRDEELIHIRRGVLLHDIGKMAVPDEILRKPGPLTDEEWEIMRQHPVYAYEMLYPIHYLRPALEIPYCHHEKWDGSGYPQGLAGEKIPLSARLFSIIDVWDALSSDRPYRQAWPRGKITTYMREQSGKHFDPRAVDEFFNLIETRKH